MAWQKKIKKTLYTLNINGYAPQITELTYPFLQMYAGKIGADFYVIDSRVYPDMPPVYEKLQIFELAKAHNNDWNIYIDSDALVHPDCLDITAYLPKDTVMHNGHDIASNRWTYDQYFLRDGRHIGSCNWFSVASDWCLDLWRPLDDLTYEEALTHIHPVVSELQTIITPEHLIDDYTLSRNIARFGLKFISFIELQRRIGDGGNYLWHQYTLTLEQKIRALSQAIRDWNLTSFLEPHLQQKVNAITVVDSTSNGTPLGDVRQLLSP